MAQERDGKYANEQSGLSHGVFPYSVRCAPSGDAVILPLPEQPRGGSPAGIRRAASRRPDRLMLQSRPFVMAVLGIDIGTGGSRAVIVDDAGRVLVSSTQAHVPLDSPQTGWAEQDPVGVR